MLNNEKFTIRAYGKSELAMIYLPHLDKDSAMQHFRRKLKEHKCLRPLLHTAGRYYWPKEVKRIVKTLGQPYETQRINC